MTIDDTIKFNGTEFRLISRVAMGCGEMFCFREVINGELSDYCKLFQVYPNHGGAQIVAYNNSSDLVPYFRKFLEKI